MFAVIYKNFHLAGLGVIAERCTPWWQLTTFDMLNQVRRICWSKTFYMN
jgi:hypothetical protein